MSVLQGQVVHAVVCWTGITYPSEQEIEQNRQVVLHAGQSKMQVKRKEAK